MAKQTIKTMKLAELNPAPYNPRKNIKPGDPVYDKLAASMDAFGYIEPNGEMVTSAVYVAFKDKPEARAEFMSMVG